MNLSWMKFFGTISDSCALWIFIEERHYHIFQHFKIKQLFFIVCSCWSSLWAINTFSFRQLCDLRPEREMNWKHSMRYSSRWIGNFIFDQLCILRTRFSFHPPDSLLCLLILSRWQLSLVIGLIKTILKLTKEINFHKSRRHDIMRLLLISRKDGNNFRANENKL